MIYKIVITDHAKVDLATLKRNEITAYNKAVKLIIELSEHPYSGTGKPQLKKYNLSGCYSRRITNKHRLVYSVEESTITVIVLSAHGHYDDK